MERAKQIVNQLLPQQQQLKLKPKHGLLYNSSGAIQSPYEPQDIPVVPLHQFLFDRWEQNNWLSQPALTDAATGESLTYGQLRSAVITLANALYATGLRKGDSLAIYSPNHLYYTVVSYACSCLGVVCCVINSVYTGAELVHHLNDSQAKFVVTSDKLIAQIEKVKSQCSNLQQVYTFQPTGSYTTVAQLLQKHASQSQKLDFDISINPKEDVQLLPYSSGTTGLAKGVMLTSYNLVSNILQYQDTRYSDSFNAGERVICLLPMSHIFAASAILNAGLAQGVHAIIMAGFDPKLFCQAIQKYKIQRASLVPPIINFLSKSPIPNDYDLTSLTHVASGAAPLSPESEEEFRQKFHGTKIRQGYGMSETGPVTHVHPIGPVVSGSIGLVASNMEAMIVDPESGKPITKPGSDNRGELWVRGPNVMKGYWRNEKATAGTIDAQGWLHTGDVAVVRDDGFFWIVDRIKELIKVKGLQVAPAELEGMLLQHPELLDSAVIPIPHERSGEVPRAYVVRRPGSKVTEKDIYDFVAKQVAAHKKLDGGIRFVESIPKLPSGKILRRTLRDQAKKELEGQSNKVEM